MGVTLCKWGVQLGSRGAETLAPRVVWDGAAAEGLLVGPGRPTSLTAPAARPHQSRGLVVRPPGTTTLAQREAGAELPGISPMDVV